MNKIKNMGLEVKSDISFPVNTLIYKKDENVIYVKNKNIFLDKKIIQQNLIPEYEISLKYL
jgi:hypothetical protein